MAAFTVTSGDCAGATAIEIRQPVVSWLADRCIFHVRQPLEDLGLMARQQARQAIRRSAGHQAARSADYNNAACVLASATGTRARCTVQASFCTTPPIAQPPQTPVQPVSPVLPQPPVYGATCYTYRAKAIGNGSDQAQHLAANALAGSLAQVGAQLGGPGVTAQDPACFYLDNGTNQVQCEMTARLCR